MSLGLSQKDQWKVRLRLAVMASDWPLLTGGRCPEVSVNTGLTVHNIFPESPDSPEGFWQENISYECPKIWQTL